MVKVQRLFAKTNLKIPVCRTRSRQGLGWDRVCEAQRSNESPSGAFKRQRGLRQQMERRCPDNAHPNKSTSETHKRLRSEVPDGPCSTRGQEPSASVGGFVLLALCGMVWYTRLSSTTRNLWRKNMQGERKNVDTTICANMSGNFILYAFRYG